MPSRRGLGISVKMIVSTTFLVAVVVATFGYLTYKNILAVYASNAANITKLRKEQAIDVGKAQVSLLAVNATTLLELNELSNIGKLPGQIKENFPQITSVYIADPATNLYIASSDESLNDKPVWCAPCTPDHNTCQSSESCVDDLCVPAGTTACPAQTGYDLLWPQLHDAKDTKVLEDQTVDGDLADVFAHPIIGEAQKLLGVAVVSFSLGKLKDELNELDAEKNRKSQEALVTTALIGGLCVLVGTLLAIFQGLRISRPLKLLAVRADQIARGDLDTRVEVKSRDEIGLLGENFNYMADRLVVLLQETAKKATMEKELEVARAIQETLVPTNDLVDRKVVKLAGYFQPASECGGDWWTYHDLADGKLLVVIGDVTGHGVPSAMITAAAKASCDSVRAMTNDNLTVTYLLEILNRAIYEAAKRKFVMTCFASIIDPKTRTITYANAGHNFPYLYRNQNGKGEFGCLMTRGNRLGDLQESKYTAKQMDLMPGDVLVWYTDGIVECENPQGEEFGEKRFRAAIRRAASEEPSGMREQVVAAASSFFSDRPRKDDITMVIARVF
jgi:serine phosphatase RsbU (regulator of sigma subunit)